MLRQQSVITSADKEGLRRELRKRRKSLAPEERQRLSLAAARALMANLHWQRARTVALYAATRGEIGTAPLLDHAWKNGKTVLLPACSRKDAGKMCFAACSGPDALCPGPFDIPEPALPDGSLEFLLAANECDGDENTAPDAADSRMPPAPDIIVVPGLAFDRRGTRLGMGGGYYDRLLSLPRYKNALRLGLAYSFQLVDRLPRESWDVPVHAVCTEKGLLWMPDTPPPPAA